MADSPLSEIRQAVDSFLAHNSALSALEDVLLPLLWDLDSDSDDPTVSFAGRIGNLIAEFTNGDRSEESLRLELAKAALPFAEKPYLSADTTEFYSWHESRFTLRIGARSASTLQSLAA